MTDGRRRGSPALALGAGLLLPGLGHALSGARARGRIVFAAAVAVAIVAVWYALEPGAPAAAPAWLALAAAPFWVAQALDAAACARGAEPGPWRLGLLAAVPIYAVGLRATEPNVGEFAARWTYVRPLFAGLASPDLVAPILTTGSAQARIHTPCGADEPRVAAPLPSAPAAPVIAADPPCVALGDRVTVRGAGFPPDAAVRVLWISSVGGESAAGAARTDPTGAFEATVTAPPDSVPERIRERSPDVPQNQAVRALVELPTGRWGPSQTLSTVLSFLGVTIALSFLATVLAALFALPLAFLGARNLMGGRWWTRGVYRLVRGGMNVVRAVEPLIMAIVFVVWVDLGPFAGLCALVVHGVAALGKLFSETIEGIDPGPVEAIRAAGASWLQVARHGVLPQIVPPAVGYVVYRMDINLRLGTVIGLVGGGGIGMLLSQWIRKPDLLPQAGTALFVIALLIVPLDFVSGAVRERIAAGRPLGPRWTRPVIYFAVAAMAVWSWRRAEVDLAKFWPVPDRVRTIVQQLARPELVERGADETVASVDLVVPCPAGFDETVVPQGVPIGAGTLALDRGCANAGDGVGVFLVGLPPGAAVRLRWRFADGSGRLDAVGRTSAGPESGDVGAVIEVRQIVEDRAVAAPGRPTQVEATVTVPSGPLRLSQPLRITLSKIVLTILMALMATTFGALMAIPLAFLAARNIMGTTGLGRVVYGATRLFLSTVRAIEPALLVQVFATWVGLGKPFPGVLALIGVTLANLGKLFSEALEDIDAGPVEALRAAGANRLQVLRYAVVPQVVPPWLAFGFYHWDINVRLSTIVGLVGGGGIGYHLSQWMNTTQWRKASVALLGIILVVTAMDTISARLRERLAQGVSRRPA
ncbi:MAG: phosphonate ABC transporter, permease protein PhnE [Ardenticatenales bacterium]|nr:phosphonate ABC transporter, permease protein PhnE [Ardenticatenales bacterium]